MNKVRKKKIKAAILTCGRSDYSIYFPLIKNLHFNKDFNLHIIAFGTHPYNQYGKTEDYIRKDGFRINYTVKGLVLGDDSQSIADSIGCTIMKIAEIYSKEKYDLIFTLGDRYEMFAAVTASVPFNISVAHLHGGEKTLGAIDEKFRHGITLMSKYHFVTTDNHAKKVRELTGNSKHVYNVGALAIDNIKRMKPMTIKDIYKQYKVNLNKPTLLATIHPETVNIELNKELVKEFIKAIKDTSIQTVITLPNNDTSNELLRKELIRFSEENANIYAYDALGARGYYSFMKYCYAVIGNSSSGIIEAASFGKYAINIGDRQKGRDRGKNVIDVPINAKRIKKEILNISKLPRIGKRNIFGEGNTSDQIVTILKRLLLKKINS